jgi:Lysyl oxidase
VKSSKEAFCLVPTDAIDLTLPAAELQPGNVGLWTSCGGRSDLWIREVLPVGWGDTYYQYVPGQSFDITDVPNGTYFVKIVANPGRQLEELSYGNNVRLRKVILRGRPGHRRVEVPPWHGIDTEGWVERYGLGPSVG